MRNEFEARRELIEVRKLLKAERESGGNTDLLYGAQQALGWMLGNLRSPSDVHRITNDIADRLQEAEDGSASLDVDRLRLRGVADGGVAPPPRVGTR